MNVSGKRTVVIGAALCLILLCMAGYAEAELKILENVIVNIGYSLSLFPDVEKKDAQVAIEIWSKQFIRAIGTKAIPRAIIFDDLESIVSSVNKHEVDMVSLPALDFIKIRENTALEPLVIALNGDKTGEEKILLVRRDNGFTKLTQLKNMRLVIQSGTKGNISMLWLDTMLMRQGLSESEQFFASIKRVSKASQAVLPVFFRQADAAVVDRHVLMTMTELNPQLTEQLTILTNSPPLLHSISCVSSSTDNKIKEAIRNTAQSLGTSPGGQQILTLFQLDRVIPFKRHYLEPLEELVREHHDLQKSLAKRR